VNNLVALPGVHNLVVQPVLELPVNVHGMVWEGKIMTANALSYQNEMVHQHP
jgi:hypothetical protein